MMMNDDDDDDDDNDDDDSNNNDDDDDNDDDREEQHSRRQQARSRVTQKLLHPPLTCVTMSPACTDFDAATGPEADTLRTRTLLSSSSVMVTPVGWRVRLKTCGEAACQR